MNRKEKKLKATRAILFFLVSLLFLFHFSFEFVAAETEFRYDEASGRGPSKWGELDPNWKACGTGQLQSPIDLRDTEISPHLGDLQISYQPAPATIKSRGHNIMVTWNGNAGAIQINGSNHMLKSCHWHTSTEHAIDGNRIDLELHMFHQNTLGEPAVVAILYKIGQPDPFLTRLLPDIRSVTKEEKPLGSVNPGDVRFSSRNYYRYIGSLTTPPCTEGVVWTVFQEVRTVSMEQVEALRNAVDEGFEMNARPLQAVNGRIINLYSPT